MSTIYKKFQRVSIDLSARVFIDLGQPWNSPGTVSAIDVAISGGEALLSVNDGRKIPDVDAVLRALENHVVANKDREGDFGRTAARIREWLSVAREQGRVLNRVRFPGEGWSIQTYPRSLPQDTYLPVPS
jgi:hypothetical protein